MTAVTEERRCRWCGRGFTVRPGPGRPRQFCRRSCRQRDYEARQRAREVGLSEADVIVARAELDELRDHLWVLEQTVRDVEADLAPASTADELRDALGWLLHAVRPLLARSR